MNEAPYSKREQDEKFNDIRSALERIEMQTTKTNGSVAKLKVWQERSIGGMTVFVLIIVPILSWSLLQIYTNASVIAVLNSKVYALTHK